LAQARSWPALRLRIVHIPTHTIITKKATKKKDFLYVI